MNATPALSHRTRQGRGTHFPETFGLTSQTPVPAPPTKDHSEGKTALDPELAGGHKIRTRPEGRDQGRLNLSRR